MFPNSDVYYLTSTDLETTFIVWSKWLCDNRLRRMVRRDICLSVVPLPSGFRACIYSSRFRCGSSRSMAMVIPLMNLKRGLPGVTAQR
jgi:hypothetical protein